MKLSIVIRNNKFDEEILIRKVEDGIEEELLLEAINLDLKAERKGRFIDEVYYD